MSTILGVGKDNQLYTRTNLSSNWVVIPNSGSVVRVTTMQDGTILAVGTDNQLYTRVTMNSDWVIVPNSGSVIGVTTMQDGTILGIGTDNQLYTRANLNSNWVIVPNSGSVIGVTTMQDGTILGIGTDTQLYTRANLSSNWAIVPNSGSVIGVTTTQDGTILGIGTDNQLYTRTNLSSNWAIVPKSGSVIGVTMVNMQNIGEFIGNVKIDEKDFEPGEQADLEFTFKNMSQTVRLKNIHIKSIGGTYLNEKITVLKSQIAKPALEPGEATQVIITMKSKEDALSGQYTVLPMLEWTPELITSSCQVPLLAQGIFNISER